MAEQRERRADPQVERALGTLSELEHERQRNPAWEARLAERGLARGMDGIAVFLIGMPIAFAVAQLRRDGEEAEGGLVIPAVEHGETFITWGPAMPSLAWLAGFLAGLALFMVYELGTTAVFGATPGKLIMGLRVVRREDRAPATAGTLALRTLVWAPVAVFATMTWFASILYAWGSAVLAAVIFGRAFRMETHRETLADRIAGTAVKDVGTAEDASEFAERRRRKGTQP